VSDVLSLHGLAGRNLLGLSLWPDTHYMHNLFGSALSNYTPADLFAAGEQGAWYDPSDMSTLFQDAAGTTPVTAVEQFVGLMLDKSKGLVLGPELVTNGTFDSGITGWGVANVGASTIAWEAGKIRISRANTGPTYPNARTVLNGLVVGRNYKIVSQTNNPFGIEAYHAIAGTSASVVRTLLPSRTLECVFTATATTHNLDIGLWESSGSVGQYVEFDNISVRELPGNHASQPTSTARPRLKQDGTGRYYLQFDGVDDFMSTGNINFTGTDKMTVWAGVRKLSDAAYGVIAELGASADALTGSFNIGSGTAVGDNLRRTWGAVLNGSARILGGAAIYAAPDSRTLTAQYDIGATTAAEECTMRLNGVLQALTFGEANAGTGNFGTHPLFIGSRAGTSLRFNGSLYQLIIRGAATNAAQLSNTDTWVNTRTGAY
jgi:hypothetical protein